MFMRSFLIICAGLFVSVSAWAHDNPLIATVNVFAVEQESVAWQKKLATFQEKFERNRAIIGEQEKTLQAELKEYEKQRPLLSAEQQQSRDGQINQKLAELQNTAGQMNASLDQESALANQSLRLEIAKLIKKVAKERKLDLILEVGAENFAVTYFTERLDITKIIIERLNKSYPVIKS